MHREREEYALALSPCQIRILSQLKIPYHSSKLRQGNILSGSLPRNLKLRQKMMLEYLIYSLWQLCETNLSLRGPSNYQDHSASISQMQLFLIHLLQIVATAFTVLGLASSRDTLNPSNSLIYGQTLNSSGGVFQFGFFNLVNGSAEVYVGIWYLNLTPREGTVVWVADTTALNRSTASLNLTATGNLIVSDEGTTIWSTNTSTELNSSRLQLLDSGNLRLIAGASNRTLWQSFDESSNSLLPGMKIGFNSLTNFTWKLVSWRSGTDPSPGYFEDRMEIQGVPQITIFNESVKLYRLGPWNGYQLAGVPKMGAIGVNFTFESNSTESYFMTNYEDGVSPAVQSVSLLAANGSYRRWHLQDGAWQLLWSIPEDHCDNYNHCGRNKVCTKGYYKYSCDCLPGFKPAPAPAENGCEREKPLSCLSNHVSQVQKVKLPDTENATAHGDVNLDACKSLCLGDCSCVAYAVVTGPNGCLTWRGDLLDLRNFTDGEDYLYVRLAEHLTSKRKQELVWEITIPLLLGFILLCCIALVVIRRRNKRLRTAAESSAKLTSLQLQLPNLEKGDLQKLSKQSNTMDFDDASRLVMIGSEESALYDSGVGPINTLGALPSYDLSTIRAATNNFSSENKLGEGGFGVVYKGQFQDGQKIAVKKLSRYSSQGPNEFQNELSLIAKLQHRNLVRLLGSCIEGDERLIILEYMENKSLDVFIYDKTRSSSLNWQKRLEIIIGIARGLLYLHQDSLLRVIHRDLKPSNILLDKDMIPKISDFGIARIFEGDGAIENATTRPIGTIGYMAPEYLNDGVFSFKSDVFSFGVIVLEILSGKRNRMTSQTDTSLNLLGHAYRLWKEGRSLEILDNALDCLYPTTEILRCIRMSLLCVQDNIEDRPTMAEVVMMLASEDQLLTPFKQPTTISTNGKEHFTTKEMSLTITNR